MELIFVPLMSGSSGNSLYLGAGDVRILVDAGVSGVRITQELARCGVDAKEISGMLITHEHSDHISGVGVLSRRYDIPIYATEGTWDAMSARLGNIAQKNIRTIEPGRDFYLGALNVMPFDIPHDAMQPVGYAFECGGIKLSIATDIGCVKQSWLEQVANSDLLLLESNHDLNMLTAGRYPYELKRRIMGKKGHLSNVDAGKAAAELVGRGVKHIILGHLSQENNFPDLAYMTVREALTQSGYEQNRDYGLDIAKRHAMSGVYRLQMRARLGEQYAGT